MNFKRLKSLLAQRHSHDLYVQILSETASLYREELPSRWYFLFLNRVFSKSSAIQSYTILTLRNQF